MSSFKIFISSYDMIDFKCSDRKYTWARGGFSRQFACLYRYLVNNKWILVILPLLLFSFVRGFSDYSPMILFFGVSNNFVKPPFCFDKR